MYPRGQTVFLSTLPAWGATCPSCVSSAASRLFLSTLPAWGATHRWAAWCPAAQHFYPRSPRGERPAIQLLTRSRNSISIHAPRVGSDPMLSTQAERHSAFLSTLPAWGATEWDGHGRDADEHFYPRSPRGERPSSFSASIRVNLFLSTLPAWGATSGRHH